ncbi:MAG: flippase-like domain-containing protein [Anaerolineales bacterium]|nr:flippase-like domain-containing protein [Anaerolineales bacterium]
MLKSVRFWIGLVISAVCLYFAFQGIQLDKLVEALIGIEWLWMIAATLVFFVSYAGRVFRWQLLFYPQKPRWDKTFYALNIGYFLSNLLPARLGDIIRAYLIGEIENVGKARALSTVVVERLSDGLTVVLLLAVTAFFVPNIPIEARQGAIGVAVTGIGGVVFLLALSLHKERGMNLLRRLTAPIPFLHSPRLWGALESLIDGFAILRSPREIIGVAAWAVFVWLTGGAIYWIVMRAMNLDASIAAAFLVMLVTSLVVVVPSSPGYIGVFHATAVFVLTTVFGIDKSAALSYAVVVHAFTYILLIGLGIFSMWHEGLTYQQLQRMKAEG